MDAFIIKQPWITEKSATGNAAGKYTFLVQPNANKTEIKKAVHAIYNVDVVDVTVVNRPDKTKRFRGRKVRSGGYKKATVTLKKGQSIDLK